MERLRGAVEAVAGVVFLASSVALGGFMFYWFYSWWGALGVFAGIVFAPLIAVFPFIYLYLEGPSAALFSLWGTGVVAAMVAGIREV